MKTVTCDVCGEVCHPESNLSTSAMKKDGHGSVRITIDIEDGDICLKCLADQLVQDQKLNKEDIEEGRL